MKKIFFLFIRITVFILLFALALQNTQKVTLALFLNYSWEAPLILIICVFFCAGLLLGCLLLLPYLWRQRKISSLHIKHSSAEHQFHTESK